MRYYRWDIQPYYGIVSFRYDQVDANYIGKNWGYLLNEHELVLMKFIFIEVYAHIGVSCSHIAMSLEKSIDQMREL